MKINVLGANRTEAEFPNGARVLYSYSTPVAAYIPGKGYVKSGRFYSRTTSKHIGQWQRGIEETVPEEYLKALIESGAASHVFA
jgi:hypothetical protein